MAFEVKEIENIGLVAIPKDSAEMGRFLGLQRAVNAALKKRGSPERVSEDGRPGPETVAYFNLVSPTQVDSVFELAQNAGQLGSELAKEAGVNFNTTLPSRPPPTNKPGATLPPLGPPPKSKKIWWIVGLAALGGVIAIGVYAGRKNKRGGRTFSPRRARA